MKKEIKSSISLPENIDDSKATRFKKPHEVETVEKDEIEKSSNKENLRGWRIYKRKSVHFSKAVSDITFKQTFDFVDLIRNSLKLKFSFSRFGYIIITIHD